MGQKIKVLIVDDEPTILHFLKFFFESWGYNVVTSNCAQEAKNKINDEYQLLITDIRMPAMNGIELGRWGKNKFSKLKVILVSGHRSENEGLWYDTREGFYCIKKPFGEMEKVKKFIETVLNSDQVNSNV